MVMPNSNGRNVLRPDDNRENGWQPQSQSTGGHWEDQRERGYNPERQGVTGGYGGGSGFEDRYGRGQQGMPGYGQQSMYAYGQEMPSHRGKGPKGYTRSDERIREHVCETLADDHNVDASDIEVTVKDGEVTLAGTVPDRRMKRMAEDVIYQLPGIQDVHNQLRAGNRK